MAIIRVPPETFQELARDMKGMPRANLRSKTFDRNYRTMFGVGAIVTSDLWGLCGTRLNHISALPKHLLWTLAFLKVHATEAVLCSFLGCDRKTLRKWVWPVLDVVKSQQARVVCTCVSFNVETYLLFNYDML